jgi:hypothetical protein
VGEAAELVNFGNDRAQPSFEALGHSRDKSIDLDGRRHRLF